MTSFTLPTPTPSDLKTKDNTIQRAGRTVFAVAGNQALLDVAARNSVMPEVHTYLDKLVAAVNEAKLELRYVSNVKGFFNPDDRWAAFLTTGDTSGLTLTDEEIAASKLVLDLRQRFDTAFTLPKLPYERIALPKGVKNGLSGITINAAKTTVSNGAGYSMTLKQVERLWAAASAVWAKGIARKTLPRIDIGGYSRYPVITPKNLTIGCQQIPRYKLEALAEKQGWAFPEVSA